MVGAWGGCAEGEEGGGTAVRWEGASPSPPLGHTAWRDLSLTARRGHRGGRAAAGLSPPTAAGGARRRFFLAGLSARTQPEHVDQLLELPGEGDAREDPKAEAKNGGRGVAGGGDGRPLAPTASFSQRRSWWQTLPRCVGLGGRTRGWPPPCLPARRPLAPSPTARQAYPVVRPALWMSTPGASYRQKSAQPEPLSSWFGMWFKGHSRHDHQSSS